LSSGSTLPPSSSSLTLTSPILFIFSPAVSPLIY
jgi:hypothetical protein